MALGDRPRDLRSLIPSKLVFAGGSHPKIHDEQTTVYHSELSEIEQAFRASWRAFAPHRYPEFLNRTCEANRLELLTRILCAELEFQFQPPQPLSAPAADPPADDAEGPEDAGDVDEAEGADGEEDSDDQRVRPCVTLFMLRFPELAQRSELVLRLILLEYALRLQHDSRPPDPESYLPYYPQQGEKLIRLLELTENKLPVHRGATQVLPSVGHSDSTVKEAALSASLTVDPLPLNLGCFLLLQLLGRGGMGFVHLAIDLRSTAQVAVKVMRRIDAWSIYRFIEEFRWLSQLSHPNLVKLYDAFCEGDVRYFSMELVEGKTIREWFRRFPSQVEGRWSELRRVLGQFASAIAYLHEHQVLHCDIKCSNLMIAQGNRGVLLDLGLAVRAGQDNRLVGTLQYMSPEVIRGGSPTYASDWYSFGVMIYEVLTDSFPPIQIDLSQTDPSATLPQSPPAGNYHLNESQLRQNLQGCPADLAELCLELMSPEPAVRPAGSQVLQRLQAGKNPLGTQLPPLECSGRQSELTALHRAVSRSDPRRAGLVVIEGESGSGKSTLLQAWAKSLRPQAQLLLSVRCYRQDHTPMRLLNALVQELTAALPKLPQSRWKAGLQHRVGDLASLFPQVQQLLSEAMPQRTATQPSSPTANATHQDVALSAFVQWLLELSRQQPLVICVDDAQWADLESLRTLKRLLVHPGGFGGSVVVVDESGRQRVQELMEVSAGKLAAESWPFELTTIQLPPLAEAACLDLLSGWCRLAEVPMNASVAHDIVRRSSGNPFLLQEFFRTFVHLTHSGDISGSDWLVADSQSSVRRRFSLLPQPAENILQFLAVADQSLSFHQLQMVSRILPHELLRTLNLLASQGWVRSRSGELDSDVEIAHDNFRRAIQYSLPIDRLHRRHYRLARILSCETPPPWARVAGHYWAAEYFREASSCYLEAARTAIASGGHAEAIVFLDRADHPQAQRTPAEQSQLRRMKAGCLAQVGSSQAAAELYDALLQEELQAEQPDEAQITMLRCLAGEQRIRAGQLDAGVARLELALKQLGITRWKTSRFSQFRWTLAMFYLRSLRRWPTRETAPAGHAQPAFSEMERCLNRVSPPLTFLDSQLGPHVMFGMKRIAQQRGSHYDRALAWSRAGILLSFAGRRWRRQALQHLRRGWQFARASRTDEARATIHFCRFVWHRQRGHLAAAARSGAAAVALYQACPGSTQWEQQFTQWAMLGTYWYSNQLRQLQDSTKALRQSAHERADPMSLFWMHVDAAHAADLVSDQPERARVSLTIANAAIVSQSFQCPHFFLWLSRIYQALYENDPRQAFQILHHDWRRLDRALIMKTNFYRWLALCARMCCNLVALRQRLPREQIDFLRDARRCIRRMRGLQEPIFLLYAEAYALALEANYGTRRPRGTASLDWETTIHQLHHFGHHLLATALLWHYSFHVAEPRKVELRCRAQAEMEQSGCVAPHKLLDIILPLPAR